MKIKDACKKVFTKENALSFGKIVAVSTATGLLTVGTIFMVVSSTHQLYGVPKTKFKQTPIRFIPNKSGIK